MVGALLGWLSYINIIQKMSFSEETEKLKHQPPVENLTFHFVFQKDMFLVLSFYSLIVPEHFPCSLQQKKKTKSWKLKNQLHITRICASSIACLLENPFFRCLQHRKCFGTVPQWKTKKMTNSKIQPPRRRTWASTMSVGAKKCSVFQCVFRNVLEKNLL